jgi:hypothetical protein
MNIGGSLVLSLVGLYLHADMDKSVQADL